MLGGTASSAAIGAAGLPPEGPLQVVIADAAGRAVRTVDARSDARGAVGLRWDGRGGDGRRVPAGVYTVALRADGDERRRTVVVIR